jgi:uncharacterized protein YdaU (DUF1376 family)
LKHYPHHIGDFNNATRHLDRLERSIYRDLIELYYETEAPLMLDVEVLSRRIVANERSTDVQRLLNEFFIQTQDGWFHSRCEEELSKYQANNSQRAQAGKASAAKKALKRQQALNGKATSVEAPLNGSTTEKQNQSTSQPINQSTNNKAPERRQNSRSIPTAEKKMPEPPPEGVTLQTWNDWLALRKAKRATSSKTVIDGAIKEANKAGMPLEDFLKIWVMRGSQGLEASWLTQSEKNIKRETPYQQTMREKWETVTGRNRKPTGEIYDVASITLD